jgi:hypothetical protein
MTGLVRKATLFAVCGLLAANVAMASTPSPANSECPGNISLIGYSGGSSPNLSIGNGTNAGYLIDPIDAPFTITVRDLNNQPVNNAFVIVDFGTCSGMQLCSDQAQAGITAVCNLNQVRGFTGPGGTLTLSVGGHANNTGTGNPSGDTDPNDGLSGAGCASIFADNQTLRSNIIVAAYDQDGNGVSPPDMSCFLGDEFGVNNGFVGRDPDRSNFDGSLIPPMVSPSDQSLYLGVYFGTNNGNVALSDQNCGTLNIVPECAAIP